MEKRFGLEKSSAAEEDVDALEDLEDSAENDDDMGVIPESIDVPINVPVYHLELDYSYDSFFAIYSGELLKNGTVVVVPTRFGRDLAHVKSLLKDFHADSTTRITRIERVAGTEDIARAERNREKEEEAFSICEEKIKQHNLSMKLVKVHYLLEESKILFFFTADNRVDFRELVKDLVAVFRTRIELRQISARIEFRMAGGIGICGRKFCCNCLSEKIKPVSIKMAKEQNLSLNSNKISGCCGRLLCCLSYEHNFYSEERRLYPYETYRLEWDGTIWQVKEINCVLGLVTLTSEDGRELMLPRKRFQKIENKDEVRWKIVN